jgi:hypothetical protein
MKNPKGNSKRSFKALPHHSSLIIHNFLAPLAAGGKKIPAIV